MEESESVTQATDSALNSQKRRCFAAFILSAVAIFIVTGLAKILAALGDGKVLLVVDPISGIKFGKLMLVAGLVELITAGICIFSESQRWSLVVIAWLSNSFVVYRVGMWWVDWKTPCSCLGNLTDALHISPQLADNIMKVILAYLLIGSYGLLFWQWRQGGNANTKLGGERMSTT